MKRNISILFLVLLLIVTPGCSLQNFFTNPDNNLSTNESGKNTSSYTINDYFPFTPGLKLSFEGKGMEYASYTTWTDYVKGNRIQTRTNNGGAEVVKVYENSNGELKNIFSKEECYYREDFTSKQANKDEILLKEPLVKGTSWTLTDGRKRFISGMDVKVSTPAGNFKAIEVTTEDKSTKTLDYYVLNTGLVKTVNNVNGSEISSSLNKIEKNSSFDQTIKIYYPNIDEEKLYFINKKFSFKTNDITKLALEKIFKTAPNDKLGKLLGPSVKINSLYLNKDNMVYADFSKELVTEMNAGSGYETMILQCITNTLGQYYGVNKVYITIENKPYSSGHYAMKKGEAFIVNTKDSVELK